MRARFIELLVILGAFIFLSSCDSPTKKSKINKKTGYIAELQGPKIHPSEILYEQSKKYDLAYEADKKLSKIDHKWLATFWQFIPPNFAFNIGKNEKCEFSEASQIFEANGDILEFDIGDKLGTWNFSDNKLTLQYIQFDRKDNETGEIITVIYYIGKISDRAAILIGEEGEVTAMKNCP